MLRAISIHGKLSEQHSIPKVRRWGKSYFLRRVEWDTAEASNTGRLLPALPVAQLGPAPAI